MQIMIIAIITVSNNHNLPTRTQVLRFRPFGHARSFIPHAHNFRAERLRPLAHMDHPRIPQKRLQEETPRNQGYTMCVIVFDVYYRPVFS